MLEKSLGNFQVGKLHIILLFNTNFDQLNKHIGYEMMHHAKQYGLVAGKHYGSCHGCSSITQSLKKHLIFDQICHDAKSCYDCIIHWIAVQSMFWCRVNKLTLVCMFSTIHHLQHHIQTLFGYSQISAGTNHWAVPISGIGQGNGVGPQIWAVVSTPILDILHKAGFGASFKLAISSTHVSLVGYSFADDTNLVQTGPTLCKQDQPSLPPVKNSSHSCRWHSPYGSKACGQPEDLLLPLNPSGTSLTSIGKGANGSMPQTTKPGTLLMQDHTQQAAPMK